MKAKVCTLEVRMGGLGNERSVWDQGGRFLLTIGQGRDCAGHMLLKLVG